MDLKSTPASDSPDGKKVAICIYYGFEFGEIYILNLKDGSYSLYKKSKDVLAIKSWKKGEGILLFRE